MRRTGVILLALLLIALPGQMPGQAQGKGSVRVRVVDAKTGEALPGANLVIKGTYYGGSTNVNGDVRVERVTPGVYTLEITLMGYKSMQVTSFRVEEDKEATFAARLEETLLTLDRDIVIVGERPMFDSEETASRRSLEQADRGTPAPSVKASAMPPACSEPTVPTRS